jgi:hypothetical protein
MYDPAFAKAFVAAQKDCESVKKANTNDHFKSKYADLAACVEAIIPALNKHGIGVMQFPKFDGELVTVETSLIHESGATVNGALSMRPTRPDPQGVGSAITYARRYSLLAMVGAAPEDDDGNAASTPAVRAPAAPVKRITQGDAEVLRDFAEDVGADLGKFCKFLKIENLNQLPADRFEEAYAALEAKREA